MLPLRLKANSTKFLWIVVLQVGFMFLGSHEVHAAWYNTNWAYRKPITIDNTKVSGSSNHTNFPVLVSLTSDSDLTNDAQADGDDILFTASDGTTKLDHEIEFYSSGTLRAWVEVPTLSYNSDTVIYMYYGYGSASSQQSAAPSWRSEYKGVYHLIESGNGTADEFNDSTSSDNNGQGGSGTSSKTPSQNTSGKIHYAQTFDGTDDYIDAGTSSIINITDQMYASLWFNAGDVSAGTENLLTSAADSNQQNFALEINRTAGRISVVWGDTVIGTGSTALSSGTWYHLAMNRSGSSGNWTLNVYLNGNSEITASSVSTDPSGGTAHAYIGGLYTSGTVPDLPFNGSLDEVRIASSNFSSDWISTEYANQNSPGTFYSLGAEQLQPTFTQTAYRFFANADSTDVGAALAAQNTAITLSSAGNQFRMRMLITVGANTLDTSGDNFKLQFAEMSGTCDTSFTGESYSDVTSSSKIAYYDNPTPADGSALTSNASDPNSGNTIINQTYEEANNFTNSQAAIAPSEDGLWDFSLIDYAGEGSKTYCLRVATSTGSAINNYTVVPSVTIPASLTFTINSVGASSVYNGITTSNASTVTTIPFGDIAVGTPKYVAQELSVASNAGSGYTVYMNVLSTSIIQGLNPSNIIDPFSPAGASWTSPVTWTSPDGVVANVNSGWIGANTTDTRVTGWSSASQKFGPVSTSPYPVMSSTGLDTGTTGYVTYAIEVNVLQPTDVYSGQIVYTLVPTY